MDSRHRICLPRKKISRTRYHPDVQVAAAAAAARPIATMFLPYLTRQYYHQPLKPSSILSSVFEMGVVLLQLTDYIRA